VVCALVFQTDDVNRRPPYDRLHVTVPDICVGFPKYDVACSRKQMTGYHNESTSSKTSAMLHYYIGMNQYSILQY